MADAISVDDSEVRTLLQKLPDHLYDQARKVIGSAARNTQAKVTKRFNGPKHTSLQNRTGQLVRSIRTSVTGNDLNTLKSAVFTRSVYAPVHEFGATIKAKNKFNWLPDGPYLAIPSQNQKTAAGVPRLTVTEAFETLDTRIYRLTGGKAQFGIFDSIAGIPLFWLVKEVKVKERLRMVKTAQDEVPTLLQRLDLNGYSCNHTNIR